ncbi:MAG: hypothetical protein PHE50_02930 [Dehalococcoidales bacterium]|nr:hypothetical protein [Dehalococcoidales bacterium]
MKMARTAPFTATPLAALRGTVELTVGPLTTGIDGVVEVVVVVVVVTGVVVVEVVAGVFVPQLQAANNVTPNIKVSATTIDVTIMSMVRFFILNLLFKISSFLFAHPAWNFYTKKTE